MNSKKLSEIADIVMGQSPRGSSLNSIGDGVPFMQGRKTFGRIHPIIDTWTTEPTKRGERGAILFSVRAPVGDMNITNCELCIGRGLCAISGKNGFSTKYIYYLLRANIHLLKERVTGTIFESVNRDDLLNAVLLVHDELDRVRITKILSSLDEKIELNTRTNDNLEKIAFTQFKQLSGLLLEQEKLGNIASVSSGKRPETISTNGPYPVVGASGIMGYSPKNNNDAGVIVIGRVGTLGIIKHYNSPIWASDNTLVIDSKYNSYLYNTMKTIDLLSYNRGSTQPLITQTDIKNLTIPFNDTLCDKFEISVAPLYEKIFQNEAENARLTRLRDTLLPELINGKIDLSKVEI